MRTEIRILDDLSNASGDLKIGSDIELIEGDIRDVAAVERLVEGCDAVIHLAAHTRVVESVEDPAANYDVNVRGTFEVLETIRRHGIQVFINASTGGAILGEVAPPINEEIPARPASPYGASKLAAEGYCWAYAQSYDLRATSLRFSNIYGPHSRRKESVVAAFIKDIVDHGRVVIYGDGSQTRDYLYVKNLVAGIIGAMRAGARGTYQLGSGEPTTVHQLIDVLREVTGRDFEVEYQDFRPGEILHTFCDVAKARDDFGFAAPTALTTGVAETWQWFVDAGRT